MGRELRVRRESGNVHVDVFAYSEDAEAMAWIYAGTLEGKTFRPAFSAPALTDAEIAIARGK